MFHEKGDLLGLLVSFPEDAKPSSFGSFGEQVSLAVYDLKNSRWSGRTPTPIVVNPQVAFAGDRLIGHGDGEVRKAHSRASSYPCDVTLDLKTKRAETRRGPVPRSSRIGGFGAPDPGGRCLDPGRQVGEVALHGR